MQKLFLAVLLFAASAAHAQASSDTAAARHLVEQLAQSFDKNDPDLLDRITTADYTFVGPNGAIETKAERLAPMRSGLLHYASAAYDEIVVRVYGTAAVATARVVTRATLGNADRSGAFRATIVMTRQPEGWIIVASQASTLVK